jgi:MraZ protein
MFIGEYTHTVDDKKRISLPAKFRKEIGNKVVATRGLDNCLFLFSHKTWEAISTEIAKPGMMQADTRGFSRFMFSGAAEIEVDSIGRILVPDYLREFADLKQTVVFAGVHDRIEIWNVKRWDVYKKKIESQADDMAEKLGAAGLK